MEAPEGSNMDELRTRRLVIVDETGVERIVAEIVDDVAELRLLLPMPSAVPRSWFSQPKMATSDPHSASNSGRTATMWPGSAPGKTAIRG